MEGKITDKSNVKKILVTAFIIMNAIPPWKFVIDSSSYKKTFSAGYSFIANPPSTSGMAPAVGVEIDFSVLSLQWLIFSGVALYGMKLIKHTVPEE